MARTDYLEEDDHIAEDGALARASRSIIKLGRAFTAAATSFSWGIVSGWFPFSAAIVGLGHSVKAITSFSAGQKARGFKELLRGAAETAYAFFLPTFLHTVGVAYAPLILMAEPIAVSLTGKTLTANVGEIIGNILDGTTDAAKRRKAEQRRTQPVVQPQMVVQPQIMQQPVVQYVQQPVMQQPQMVQQVPVQYVSTVPAYVPGSISTVPAATVAYNQPIRTDPPPVQAIPNQRSWVGYVNGRREAAAVAAEAMQAQIQPAAAVPGPARPQQAIPAGYATAVTDGSLAAGNTPLQQA